MKRTIIALFFLLCGSVLPSTASQKDSTNAVPHDSNCVLIFLDDIEQNQFGSLTSDFFSAIIQEAAPIIVSASLINNIHAAQVPQEKDPRKLIQTLNKLGKKHRTPEEEELFRDIMVSSFSFDAAIANNWILKKINSSLYLLVPKKYLYSKGITPESVHIFSLGSPIITSTEQALGLKVNHMETVAVSSVKAPDPVPELANYFVDSLDTMFVKTREYSHHAARPKMAIYINGHGLINKVICSLSIAQFKQFLNFLTKLDTTLFVYESCYASGTNQTLLYGDAMKGVDAAYNFTIIAIALTDAPTCNEFVALESKKGKIVPMLWGDYTCFVQAVTQSEIPDYSHAIRCLKPKLYEINIPQIRLPGLPWFSILDYPTVAPIGSVMAKSRTAPLDVAQFFAKNAKKEGLASPYVILLYDQFVPFELVVNTYDNHGCYMPLIVSMVPGDRVHYIKKISSSCNLVHDILKSFYLEGLACHKVFVIDEITAPFSAHMSNILTQGQATAGTITDVIIDVTEDECTQYFTYKGTVYVTQGCFETQQEEDKDCDLKIADVAQKKKYDDFLKLAQQKRPQPRATIARIRAVQEKKAKAIQEACP